MHSQPSKTGFIPEIQGLRTIALILVATFHVWFGRVSGGVDIFLLISAYLMTRSLTGRFESGKTFSPGTFLVKKFARLMPAAVAVIILTSVAAVTVLSVMAGQNTITDAVSSMFYVENFNLQQQATNYFNANQAVASPFQHFWSLSIQGQVFVLWALIHAAAASFARRANRRIRPILLTVFGVIAAASFGYSLWLTAVNQPHAYFDTGARLWEFAAGSLLAVVQPWVRLNTASRTIASWLGVAATISCGFVLPVSSSFPGLAALWPVTSAALIILASGEPTRLGADRLLASTVLKTIGGYTYALYLTHWPVLVFYLSLTGITDLNAAEGALVLAISAVFAVLVVHLIERPAAAFAASTARKRQAKPKTNSPSDASINTYDSAAVDHTSKRTAPALRQAITIAICLLLGGATVFGTGIYRDHREAELFASLQSIDPALVGANAINVKNVPLQSPVDIAPNDWAKPGFECASDDKYASDLCYEIRPQNGSEPTHEIMMIGSSHMTQFTALVKETVGRHSDMAMRAQVAPGCYFHIRENMGDDCAKAWENGTKYILDHKPDLVIVHASLNMSGTNPDQKMQGLEQWVKDVRAASPSTQVIALRDNGRLEKEPLECVKSHGTDAAECESPTNTEMDAEYVSSLTEAGAIWVDLNQWQCPDGVCRPVVGGVPVFLDTHHVTATYTRTMAQHFADQVAPNVSWWPINAYEGEYVERADVNNDSSQDLNDAQ
ncbi:acyltransferase family protein [Gulosibacter bifidus]|uniref:Acyltransferase family protein n=1 Tax=Gulosibacter bifidus TaxID=272239 RepID=A0ABW5RIT8_9MICO|nr:acyltransferase family protein [Gulosibacter bifidus]